MNEIATAPPKTNAFSRFMQNREHKRLTKEVTEALVSVYETGDKELLEKTLKIPGAIPIIGSISVYRIDTVTADFVKHYRSISRQLQEEYDTSFVVTISVKHPGLTGTFINTPQLLESLPADHLKDFGYVSLVQGNKEAFKRIISKGIQPNDKLSRYASALWNVCSYGYTDLLEDLCQKSIQRYQAGDLNVVSNLNKTLEDCTRWFEETKQPKFAQCQIHLQNTLQKIEQLAHGEINPSATSLTPNAPKVAHTQNNDDESLKAMIVAMGDRITELEKAYAGSQKQVATLEEKVTQLEATLHNPSTSLETQASEDIRPLKIDKLRQQSPLEQKSAALSPNAASALKA